MKFSRRRVQLKSFDNYLGFRSRAPTTISYEIRADQVEKAQISGSFTWTPLDELLELAAIPAIIAILDRVSVQ